MTENHLYPKEEMGIVLAGRIMFLSDSFITEVLLQGGNTRTAVCPFCENGKLVLKDNRADGSPGWCAASTKTSYRYECSSLNCTGTFHGFVQK